MLTENLIEDERLGGQAFRDGKRRTDNPYLSRAILWDRGFVAAARNEPAKTKATTKIVGFKDWICSQ